MNQKIILAWTICLVGHLSDVIKNRRFLILIGNVMTILLSGWLIYLPEVSLTTAYALLFFIGVFTAPQILVFAIAKDLSPPLTTGIATAMTNFIVTIGAALFQPLIGYVLDLQWQGKTTAMGTPLFTVSEYQVALSLLVASLGISLILIAFLPGTHRLNQ